MGWDRRPYGIAAGIAPSRCANFPDKGKRPDAGEASDRFLGKKKEKEKRGYQNREPRGQLPVWMVSVYGTNLNKVLIIQKNFENLFQTGCSRLSRSGPPSHEILHGFPPSPAWNTYDFRGQI